jgi:hypothetical protein
MFVTLYLNGKVHDCVFCPDGAEFGSLITWWVGEGRTYTAKEA